MGRLVQRFSKDMDQMDQQLPGAFSQLIASTLNILGALLTVSLATPSFALIMVRMVIVYTHHNSDFYTYILHTLVYYYTLYTPYYTLHLTHTHHNSDPFLSILYRYQF